MKPCVSCIYFIYCMQYVWKSSLWIGIYFKELHNEQEYYWPTIYRAWAAVVSTITSVIYKISKIVRALWLAERSVFAWEYVNMVVASCFAFRALITQARIWKSFQVKTRQVYFIYPFFRRLRLGKSLQRKCVNFYRLSWHFKREKSVFWKASFCKTRLCDW